MQQGLGPALDRAPVANTCFWVGKIVGKVDNAGNIKVSVHICLDYLVVEDLFEITVASQPISKTKKKQVHFDYDNSSCKINVLDILRLARPGEGQPVKYSYIPRRW